VATVILSTNDNDNYLFYLPLVCWAWKKFDFDSLVIMPDRRSEKLQYVLKNTYARVEMFTPHNTYREDTQVQVSRLFAGCYDMPDDEYMITSDVDMMPLSSYFFQWFQDINYFGHDLTGYTHIPMCYVGMQAGKWRELMSIRQGDDMVKMMCDEMTSYPEILTGEFQKYWFTDQNIITQKLRAYGLDRCNKIDRGILNNGCAKGRVCRAYGFDIDIPHPTDAHLLRPGYEEHNFTRIFSLMQKIWPQEDLQWVIDYRQGYMKYI